MKLAIVVILVGAIILVSWAPWSRGNAAAVDVVGSTSVQPFAEMLAQEYVKRFPEDPVEVQGGGSAQGLQAARNGIAHIVMCSRELKDTPDEKGTFNRIQIARDGLAIVVHPRNPIAGLTREQAKEMFQGELTNWSQVGGENRPVRLITREEGSGTREAFSKLVMHEHDISPRALTQESNGAVKALVKSDACAIGYMSLGLVGHELKAISIDGAAPTAEEVKAGRYKLVRPFLFVTKGEPTVGAQKFIDFVLSDDAQAMLAREGLISVR